MNNEIILDSKAVAEIRKIVGGGDLIKVDTLPEVGKEGVLYKTPDGKYYTCTNTTEEKVISDLKVGKSFKLKDKVTAGDITSLLSSGQAIVGLYFDEEGYSLLNLEKITYEDDRPTEYYINYDEGDNDSIEYHCTSNSLPEDLIEPTLEGFTEIPSATITQYFVDNLTNENLELLDIAFLFEGGSHTETITTSTWEELGGKNKYFEFPNEETFKLEFYPQKFLDVLVKLNIDIDAEMETMLDYSTSGGIYIGSGALSYASSEGHNADAFYATIYATEGSGNSETFFSLMAGDYEPIAYSSDAYTIEEPFTIKKLVEALGDVCITEGANLSNYRNTVLAPRIGIKTGSSSNDTTWYDCSLEDMQSFLKVIPSND